jgi:short-subunit dehydrogenase
MKGKVGIVTGASSGIGKALCYELAKQGSHIILVARRLEIIEEIAKEINLLYKVETLAIKADVSIESDCQKFVDQTVARFGKIDILINNAGISQRVMFANLQLSVIHKVMDTNFWGSVNSTKFALPYLLEQKGSLVAVSSISGFSPLPARTGYCASKYALHGFMESLRIELLHSGMHIMVVAPEYVNSEIRKHALLDHGQEQGDSPRKESEMLTAELVAKRIVKGIKKRRRTMLIGKMGTLIVGVSRIFPKLSDKLIYYYIKKETDSPF